MIIKIKTWPCNAPIAGKFLVFVLALFLATPLPGCQNHDGDELSLEQKAARMLMFGFRGGHLADTSILNRFLQAHPPGGLILFDYDVPSHSRPRNISSPEQLSALTQSLKDAAGGKLLIAVDQEGGKVARLKSRYGFADFPSAASVSELSTDSAKKIYSEMAAMLQNAGINFNLAPVVDVNINAECPVIGRLGRSYSPDPADVVLYATAFIEAMANHRIASCLKHFPGHGSAHTDSHKGFTDVSQTWTEKELLPYQKLIENGFAEAIMTAHVFNEHLDPDDPASLSYETLTGLLRNKLQFKGLIISDDMAMSAIVDHYGMEEAIKKAILAGADLLIFSNNGHDYDPQRAIRALNIIVELVEQGEIPVQRINESCERVSGFIEKYGH